MTAISVSKVTISELLESGNDRRFVIPEYQRPYAWTDEQIETLFDDLAEYTANNHGDDSKESTYFLGTIVTYENEGKQEIIDGQQRITSLSLLLRAIYSKLETMTSTPERDNFIGRIESSLWKKDALTGQANLDEILIVSHVMSDDGNEVFKSILSSGVADKDAKDSYSKNYRQLQSMVEKYATDEPELFYWLIHNILKQVIVLPIEADTQETALTIFSTLNDRGLALSDADIFKAKIYNKLTDEQKKGFIQQWQQLDEEATDAGESIQRLFYYYMFYLRALEDDRKTTTPGVRKYYLEDAEKRLFADGVLSDLANVLNLWKVVNKGDELEDGTWWKNADIRQALDSLSYYPNEFWKYPVVIYYLKHHGTEDFDETFLKFLRQLAATLLAKYIISPTINSVKRGILNLDAAIVKTSKPSFDFGHVDENELADKIKNAHSKTVRMILTLLAYERQEELLPASWEIEHVLPQKWQTTYFPANSDSEVKELVEHIGNKVPFEKKLNIIASNGYFDKKKDSYRASRIQIIKDLADEKKAWGLDEIRERDVRISDEMMHLLKDWGLNRENAVVEDRFSVQIPNGRMDDYAGFLAMFGKADTDEARMQFLSI